MKTCTKCFHPKELDGFPIKSTSPDGRDTKCLSCGREYRKTHYRLKKHLYLARNDRTREILRTFIIELKSGPCTDCKSIFRSCVMEFDHRDGSTKKYTIAQMAEKLKSKRQILEEVAKCDLVCANCHRIRSCDRDHRKDHAHNA